MRRSARRSRNRRPRTGRPRDDGYATLQFGPAAGGTPEAGGSAARAVVRGAAGAGARSAGGWRASPRSSASIPLPRGGRASCSAGTAWGTTPTCRRSSSITTGTSPTRTSALCCPPATLLTPIERTRDRPARLTCWPVGSAVLWLPFFLVAHALVASCVGRRESASASTGAAIGIRRSCFAGNTLYGCAGHGCWPYDVARRGWPAVRRRCGRSLPFVFAGNLALLHHGRALDAARRVGVCRQPCSSASWLRTRGLLRGSREGVSFSARLPGPGGGWSGPSGPGTGRRAAGSRRAGSVQGRPGAASRRACDGLPRRAGQWPS